MILNQWEWCGYYYYFSLWERFIRIVKPLQRKRKNPNRPGKLYFISDNVVSSLSLHHFWERFIRIVKPLQRKRKNPNRPGKLYFISDNVVSSLSLHHFHGQLSTPTVFRELVLCNTTYSSCPVWIAFTT